MLGEAQKPRERIVLIGQGGIDGLEDVLVRLGRALDFHVVVIGYDPMLSEKPNLPTGPIR